MAQVHVFPNSFGLPPKKVLIEKKYSNHEIGTFYTQFSKSFPTLIDLTTQWLFVEISRLPKSGSL